MTTTKKRILKKFDESYAKLNKSPIIIGLVDGGLSTVPFLGPAISSILDNRSFKIFEKNSRNLAREIKDLLGKLDEDKIDKDFLQSDEFSSIILSILSKNALVYQEEKTKLFAQFLINAITRDKSSVEYKESFLQIIDEISPNHVKILKVVYDQAKKLNEYPEREIYRMNTLIISDKINIPKSKVDAYCLQLLRHGVLKNWSSFIEDNKPNEFMITDYGIEFVKFLIVNS